MSVLFSIKKEQIVSNATQAVMLEQAKAVLRSNPASCGFYSWDWGARVSAWEALVYVPGIEKQTLAPLMREQLSHEPQFYFNLTEGIPEGHVQPFVWNKNPYSNTQLPARDFPAIKLPIIEQPFPISFTTRGYSGMADWGVLIAQAARDGDPLAQEYLRIRGNYAAAYALGDRLALIEALKPWEALYNRLLARAESLEKNYKGARALFAGTATRKYYPIWVLLLPSVYIVGLIQPLIIWDDAVVRVNPDIAGFDAIPYIPIATGLLKGDPDMALLATMYTEDFVAMCVETRKAIHEAKLAEAKAVRSTMLKLGIIAVSTLAGAILAGAAAAGGLALLKSGLTTIASTVMEQQQVKIAEMQAKAEAGTPQIAVPTIELQEAAKALQNPAVGAAVELAKGYKQSGETDKLAVLPQATENVIKGNKIVAVAIGAGIIGAGLLLLGKRKQRQNS